ncbi:MAG: hypothetical protein HRU80_04200 [Ignavibacteriales bacterium]|nr:MAG: hypothetical protein HRU80_04200 [Ignavibacteriales bacterium]
MKQLFLALLILLIIVSSVKTTSPLPPPASTFIVEGYVQCDTISDRSLYTVVLYGRKNGRDSALVLLRGMGYQDEQPVALTLTNGYFRLRVSDWEQLDTICPVIIADGGVKYRGLTHPVDKTRLQPVYTYFRDSDNDNYGCNSCNSDEVSSAPPYVSKYEYYLFNAMIHICN